MIIDEVLKHARKIILKYGNHQPMLFVFGSTGRVVMPIMYMPETSSQRVAALEAVGAKLAGDRGVGVLSDVFFISEGWMSRPPAGKLPSVQPSLDPKRVEVLVISSLDVEENKQEARAYEIIRDSANKLPQLSPVQELDAQSGFTPMLPAFVKGYYHKPH